MTASDTTTPGVMRLWRTPGKERYVGRGVGDRGDSIEGFVAQTGQRTGRRCRPSSVAAADAEIDAVGTGQRDPARAVAKATLVRSSCWRCWHRVAHPSVRIRGYITLRATRAQRVVRAGDDHHGRAWRGDPGRQAGPIGYACLPTGPVSWSCWTASTSAGLRASGDLGATRANVPTAGAELVDIECTQRPSWRAS